jgi:tetratricopeptide (TPR) repeat protein
MDRQQLESARSALEVGDYDDALDRYNALLNSGQGLSLLISDLETASTRYTNNAPLRRLLGDAYMRNGQLQKAIDTYRQALDQL